MNAEAGTWHYVRRNETTRQPRRHIFLDTEARTLGTGVSVDQCWRLGVACFRDARKGHPAREHTTLYATPRELWRDVTDWVPARGRAVLWSHNLGYDLRISQALIRLPAAGWRVVGHNLAPAGAWLAWRRGDQSLIMVDSAAVFPDTLANLAAGVGWPIIPMPGEAAPTSKWEARCRRDVAMLRDLVVTYLARLEDMDLGNWQYTGTGQAWAAFRHQHLTHDMLVHWDPDARAAEREAMWAGRCEAYWHGRTRGVRVDEWDMTLAYPRIAMTHPVPVALAAAVLDTADMHRWLGRDGYVVLAEVEVSVDEPLVPTHHQGRIAWPVGSFSTTLWSPELRLLVARGAHVRAVRGWAYRAEPALASWAAWMVDQLGADDHVSPPWWKTVCKHWARALIGRMAMTYRAWEHVATADRIDVRSAVYIDRDTGTVGQSVQLGYDIFVATETTEWSESMPMVTGYVQSACRAWLTQLLLEAPARAVLYADTDSMLVSEEHHDQMAALAQRHDHMGLRLKRSWASVDIRGPRQIITGGRVRCSGIPVRAQRLPDGDLVGEVWQSLATAVRDHRPEVVRVTSRRWHLRGVDRRRTPGVDGWTEPLVLSSGAFPPPAAPTVDMGGAVDRGRGGRARRVVRGHDDPPALVA